MMNKVIALDGIDYLICNDLVVDNVNYLYVVSLDGTKYSLLERKMENGVDTIESITDESIIKKILGIIANQENN